MWQSQDQKPQNLFTLQSREFPQHVPPELYAPLPCLESLIELRLWKALSVAQRALPLQVKIHKIFLDDKNIPYDPEKKNSLQNICSEE